MRPDPLASARATMLHRTQQLGIDRGQGARSAQRRLGHREEAEQFYGELQRAGIQVRVGMETSGHARWFERLLRGLQFELWIGDAAEIRTKRVIDGANGIFWTQKTSSERGDSPFLRHASAVLKQSKHKA